MTDYLRLHTADNGSVWYGDSRVLAADSGLNADAFVTRHPAFRASRLVRLLGCGQNAGLVESIHQARARGGLSAGLRVQLGNPVVCGPGCPPHEALSRVWYSCSLRDGFSHWYTMTDADYTPYALAASVRAGGGVVPERARRLLDHHPAWPALAFVPGHDVDACCRLLADVVDPRWFVHAEKPGRLTKLYDYLGLCPDNVVAMLAATPGQGPPSGRHYGRAVTAVTAWCGHPPELLTSRPPPDLSPRDFLRRVYHSHEGRVRGVLVTTQRFVRFVKEVWAGERPGPSHGHFDPAEFFRGDEEADVYREHRRSLGGPTPIDSPGGPQ